MISPHAAALLGFVLLLLLLAFNTPIAFAFALVGIIGSLYLGGKAAMLSVLAAAPYTWASYFVLLTAPMFILMGYLAAQSEISRELFSSANKWLGHLPGGLALATVAACTGFAACTGSSTSSAAAMATICMPEMKKYGYDRRLAAGTVAIGGTLGILIPPSTLLIVYGVLVEESIGKLFMAGVFPGFMLSFAYMTGIFLTARVNPALAPPGAPFSWRERLASLKDVSGMLLLLLLVMGGIWGGVFTPTEAAAVGAFGALLLALFKGKLSAKMLTSSLMETVRTTGMIFAIVIGAMIFNYFLAITNLPNDLAEWIGALPVSRYVIVATILAIYVPLGMFMDALAMVVLTVPTFYAVITALGFNGIWFGILVTVMAEIGLVTPPVGMNCYVVAGIAKDVPLADVFRGILPFVLVAFVGVAVLAVFPQISLWLPTIMSR